MLIALISFPESTVLSSLALPFPILENKGTRRIQVGTLTPEPAGTIRLRFTHRRYTLDTVTPQEKRRKGGNAGVEEGGSNRREVEKSIHRLVVSRL